MAAGDAGEMKVTEAEGRRATVLVVEDDPSVRFGVSGALRELGFHVLEAGTCEAAVAAFAARPAVVVTDLRLPDGDALGLLPKLKAIDPEVPVFIVTGYGSIDLAVRAVKDGAEDFLTKPVDMKRLGAVVRDAADRRAQQRTGRRARYASGTYESRSPAMQRVEEQIEKLRQADCAVLLLGETGTGKSVLARRIHAIGARAEGPLVDINCAGLTKDFVESELFGHERGAFTGAHAAKQGLFDAANGGTLFLDEIGDVDPQVQPKLLKVLEEKRFRRMGDVRERSVDVRLIGATHHDLLAAVARGQFRADLYYRVSTVALTIPALRDRREDILALARHVLGQLGADDVELAQDARQALLDHPWPGNLRELKNVLERALLLRSGGVLRADDLGFDRPSLGRVAAVSAPPSSDPYLAGPTSAPVSSSRTLSEMERAHIQGALEAENGKVEAAARRLGIPRSTLYQRIKAYGISASQLRKAYRDAPKADDEPASDGPGDDE
ncbi:MAG: Response regulator of zinc sigma-54-dependent two-component system [Labilithrix sp.]|nr:Response regulator of zinc sigma-54-dependent two-component system [Labilithrix sp.]